MVLEYYLATLASSLEALPAKVDRVLRVQILASQEFGIEPFEGYQVAPLRYWRMFQSGTALATPYSTEIRTWAGDKVADPLPGAGLGPFRRDDYLRFPEGTRCELLYGWLLRRPKVDPVHQVVLSQLAWRIEEHAEGRGGLALGGPIDTVLAEHTILQPDVCYVVGGRVAEIVGDGIEGAPDLVAEILSPESVRRDRGEKLRAYAELGVREYWLVDPAARQIEPLVNRAGSFEAVDAVDGIYRSGAIPGLELNLADFWNGVAERLPASAKSSATARSAGAEPEGPGEGTA